MSTKKERQQAEAIERLKEWGLKKNTLVYGKVTKVSNSGMSRNITLYILDGKRMVNISHWVAEALGWPSVDGFDGGIRVSGCGMDMVFHTVYTLSDMMGYGPMNQREWEPRRKGLRLQTI